MLVVIIAAILILREYRGDVDIMDTLTFVKNRTMRMVAGNQYGRNWAGRGWAGSGWAGVPDFFLFPRKN